MGGPLISWQVPASPGPFSGRGLGILFEMYSFYAGRSSGLPCEINRPDASKCGAVPLPRKRPWAEEQGGSSSSGPGGVWAQIPEPGSLQGSLRRTQVASCASSLVGSRLLRVGRRNLYVKKSCPVALDSGAQAFGSHQRTMIPHLEGVAWGSYDFVCTCVSLGILKGACFTSKPAEPSPEPPFLPGETQQVPEFLGVKMGVAGGGKEPGRVPVPGLGR